MYNQFTNIHKSVDGDVRYILGRIRAYLRAPPFDVFDRSKTQIGATQTQTNGDLAQLCR